MNWGPTIDLFSDGLRIDGLSSDHALETSCIALDQRSDSQDRRQLSPTGSRPTNLQAPIPAINGVMFTNPVLAFGTINKRQCQSRQGDRTFVGFGSEVLSFSGKAVSQAKS